MYEVGNTFLERISHKIQKLLMDVINNGNIKGIFDTASFVYNKTGYRNLEFVVDFGNSYHLYYRDIDYPNSIEDHKLLHKLIEEINSDLLFVELSATYDFLYIQKASLPLRSIIFRTSHGDITITGDDIDEFWDSKNKTMNLDQLALLLGIRITSQLPRNFRQKYYIDVPLCSKDEI
jgi:hypothetical protein